MSKPTDGTGVDAAVLFLSAQPGAADRALAAHRRRPDGHCTGCFHHAVRWPCCLAALALRAVELSERRTATD